MEVALIAGAFILNYFAHAKLGMNRWLVHRDGRWEEQLPLALFQILIIVALAAVVVAAFVVLIRARRKKPFACLSLAAAIVLLCVLVWFCRSFDAGSLHAYYLMALCLALACAIQAAKAVVFASRCRPTAINS